MRLLHLAAIAALACLTSSRAQRIATVVVYVTVPPSSTSAAAVILQSASAEDRQQDDQSTFPPLSSEVTASTPSTSPTPTSHVDHEATSSQSYPQATAAASTAPTYYEPGQPGGGGIDTEGGASGSDAAAFRLSKGGLAAILIVVILMSLFGSECYGLCASETCTDAPHSRKYRAFHRRQTKAMDYASDSHKSVPSSDRPFHSAKDSTDGIGSK